MQWFSNLFKKDVGSSGYIQPDEPWPRITPLPEVKPPKPEKNISEPVFAIVECMKKYPSRFKMKETRSDNHYPTRTFTDVRSKQKLIVQGSSWGSMSYYDWSWGWVTKDEKSLLETTFYEINKIKHARMHSIQRAKMKGIYK